MKHHVCSTSVAAIAACLCVSASALAQDAVYKGKQIRMVIGSGAGGRFGLRAPRADRYDLGQLAEDRIEPERADRRSERDLDRRGIGRIDEPGREGRPAHRRGSTIDAFSGRGSPTLRTAVPDVKNSSVCVPHTHSEAAHSTPVMPVAAGEERNTAVFATSAGVTSRPSG